MKLQILLNDYYDISEYCLEIPEIRDSVIESISTDNTCSITVYNIHKFCDMFNGLPLSHFDLYIRDIHSNNKLILKGRLTEVKPKDDQKAEIIVKNDMYNLDKNISQSYYNKTLSQLLINIESDYSLNINNASVVCLIEELHGYEYSVRVNTDETLSLVEAINQLSEATGIFIYTSFGALYVKPYNRIGSSLYFSEINTDDILVWEKEITYDKIINQMSIKYYMGQETPVGDENNFGNNSRTLYGEKAKGEIDASQQSNVMIMSKDGALQSVDNYIRRYRKAIEVSKLSFSKEYFIELELGEWYLIDNKYYQLITKALTTNGNKCECEFWS
jgi:hypothetical protein